MAQAVQTQPSWIEQPLESFRCRNCQKLLFKVTPDALKPGAALEIRCECKTKNYLMGR